MNWTERYANEVTAGLNPAFKPKKCYNCKQEATRVVFMPRGEYGICPTCPPLVPSHHPRDIATTYDPE